MSHGEEDESDHRSYTRSPQNGWNGDTLTDRLFGTSRLKEGAMWHIAESKNCGARETAFAKERL
jgi:hypothetical protein